MSKVLSRKPNAITWLLVGPVLFYCVLIFKYAVNFPFLDDYGTILAHLLLPAKEELANWFSTHNVHVHWVLKASASLDAWLFGEVNLIRLMWVGVAFFILFYRTLLSACLKWKIPEAWIIPLPFILFQPSYWGTMTWATTSLHNFPGILFAFSAILLWAKSEASHKVLALICLISALFTNGFGVAALIAIISLESFSLVKNHFETRAPNSTASFISLGALVGVLAGWILFRTWQGVSFFAGIDGLNILLLFQFFTNFLGSCIHFLGSPWITFLAIAQLGVFILLSTRGLPCKNPELYFLILYLLLCAIVTTFGRADMGPRQGLASRYRIYSTLLVGIQYLGLAQLYREKWETKRWLLASVTGVALLFFASSLLVNMHNLAKICDRLLADKVRWTMGEPIQEFPYPEHAARVLKETGEAGIFLPRDGPEH